MTHTIDKRVAAEDHEVDDDRLTSAGVAGASGSADAAEDVGKSREAVISAGRCRRMFRYIRTNLRRSALAVFFVICLITTVAYLEDIISHRACFFLRKPYKDYKLNPTTQSCDNLLPPSEYNVPLDAALPNRHPNTTYNVVLFGDSMITFAYNSHNLTGT